MITNMNMYKDINREITLKNQELKAILAARTAEVNQLQCELLYSREQNKELRGLIMEVIHKNSQQYNRLITAVSNNFNFQQQQQSQEHQQLSSSSMLLSTSTSQPNNKQNQEHQQLSSSSMLLSTSTSQPNNKRQSSRLSKSLNVSNRNDPVVEENRRSLSQHCKSANSLNDDDKDNSTENDSIDHDINNKKEEMIFEPITRRRLSQSKKTNYSGDEDDLDENAENIHPDDNQQPDQCDMSQRSGRMLSIINETNESLYQKSCQSFADRKSIKLQESIRNIGKKSKTPECINFVQNRRTRKRKSMEFAYAGLSNSALSSSMDNDDDDDDDSSWHANSPLIVKKRRNFVTTVRGKGKKPIVKLSPKEPSISDTSSANDSTPSKTPTKDELSAALVASSTPFNNNASTVAKTLLPSTSPNKIKTRRSLKMEIVSIAERNSTIGKFNDGNSDRRSSQRSSITRNIKIESPKLTKTGRVRRRAAPTKPLIEPRLAGKLRRS